MENRIFAVLALALCLAGAAHATLYVDSYSVSPASLNPGQEGVVTFAIQNPIPTGLTTTDQLESVQVFYAAPAGIEYKAASPFMVGTISAGGSALVTVPFKVRADVKGGVITAPFYISMKDATDLKTINAGITVVNPAILSFSSDHQTVLSTDLINLTITNNGGSASRASLSFAAGSNFSFVGLTSIYIGDIKESVSVMVPLDSRKVAEGVTGVPFVLSYTDDGGNSISSSNTLTLAIKKEKADVAFTQLEPIVTNKDNVLRMKVKNNGRPLEDFRVYLTDELVKAKDSTPIKLGTLGTDDEKTFEILVFVTQQPGLKATSFQIKWVEEDVDKEEAISVPIAISSDAEVGIYLDAKPAPIAVGGDYTLSATVSNLGSYKIANVVVSLEESDAFVGLNVQKEQYIGNLDNDAFSTVQYKIRVKPAIEAGQYPLVFKVRYKDQSGLWIEKEIRTMVSVRPASEGVAKDNGSGTLMLIGGVAVVAVGYWYFRMRKPKHGLSQKSS
ncbi:MAG: hypothetical protein WC717_00985 [Candidatus Micrarchaeia archaeon]